MLCVPLGHLRVVHTRIWLLRSHEVPCLAQQLLSHLLVEPANGSPEHWSVLPRRCLGYPAWIHTLRLYPWLGWLSISHPGAALADPPGSAAGDGCFWHCLLLDVLQKKGWEGGRNIMAKKHEERVRVRVRHCGAT